MDVPPQHRTRVRTLVPPHSCAWQPAAYLWNDVTSDCLNRSHQPRLNDETRLLPAQIEPLCDGMAIAPDDRAVEPGGVRDPGCWVCGFAHMADVVGVIRRWSTLVVVAAALAAAGCETETSSTVTAGPDPVKCQVTLAGPSTVDAAGGMGRLTVTTQPECAWDASSPANWMTAFTPASGQGTADVEFRIAPNDGSSGREADVVVNGNTVRVSQRAPCRYALGPSSQSIGPEGGARSVTVTTSSECAWNASTDVNWLAATGPISATGNATLSFEVARNDGGPRVGTVSVAGEQSAITQGGVAPAPPPSCSYTIAPTSQNIAAAGGTGTPVTVTAQSGCQWTAVSNASWITVTAGSSRTGNGTVSFSV